MWELVTNCGSMIPGLGWKQKFSSISNSLSRFWFEKHTYRVSRLQYVYYWVHKKEILEIKFPVIGWFVMENIMCCRKCLQT